MLDRLREMKVLANRARTDPGHHIRAHLPDVDCAYERAEPSAAVRAVRRKVVLRVAQKRHGEHNILATAAGQPENVIPCRRLRVFSRVHVSHLKHTPCHMPSRDESAVLQLARNVARPETLRIGGARALQLSRASTPREQLTTRVDMNRLLAFHLQYPSA